MADCMQFLLENRLNVVSCGFQTYRYWFERFGFFFKSECEPNFDFLHIPS